MNEQVLIEPKAADLVAQAYHNQTFVYFDLETIPCQSPEYLEALKSKVQAPATYKKPDSIKQWLDENRDNAAQEAMDKTSFDGGRGHVCTIAWSKNDGKIRVCFATGIDAERSIITAFFEDLDPYHSETLVGHNIVGFDLPFLLKRAVALGIRLPSATTLPRDPKPWDKTVQDTMVMWAGAKGNVSMDNLCDILGIKGKDGFDGSMVAEAWTNGDHETIASYCRDDVHRTREIHKRFLMAGY